MNTNFLEENLTNIDNSLSRTNEDEFIRQSSFLMNDSFKRDPEYKKSLRCLYANILNMNRCIIENRASIEKTCVISNDYRFNSFVHYDNNEDAEYLMTCYAILVRFLIEYLYKQPDSVLIERIVYAIDNYRNDNSIYQYVNDECYCKFLYLYAKNNYSFRLINSDIQSVNNKLNKLTVHNNKLDTVLSKAEEISNKYNELKNIDDVYFKDFKNKLRLISSDLETGVYEKIKTVEDLDEKINQANDNLTLKGLSGAYGELSVEKRKEKSMAGWILLLSIVLVFLPFIIKFVVLSSGMKYDYFEYIITGSMTLIFIYYFRVALLNYNSVKTELNQINLRMALCKFINGYVEFSQRNNNHESLSKFENLIFSNVIPDDKNIPATLDGLEQLAKLISALKTK